MFDYIFLIFGLIVLLLASIIDLKTREIPNFLSYSLISLFLGLVLLRSVFLHDFHYFFVSILWSLLFVALAFIMYYSGQWGGGDSKVLMSMGLLFSFYPEFLYSYFDPLLVWPLPIIFLLNLAIFGCIYGLIISIIFAVKNFKSFSKSWTKINQKTKFYRILVGVLFIIFVLLSFIFNLFYVRLLMIFLAVFPIFIYVLVVFAKSVESSCMILKIPISQLTEGDWIVENISYKNKHIVGPKDLGISKEQIDLLIKYKIKTVVVKYGVPFVPAFLISAIFTWIFGNVIMRIFLG